MAMSKILLIATVAAFAVPAAASVVVMGNSAAQSCYEAADSRMRPTADQVNQCNLALRQEPLSRYEIAATHVNRGILHMRLGKTDASISDFDSALAVDANQPEAYLNKAVALLRKPGMERDALTLFETALDKRTRRPAIAYYGRAVANEEIGNIPAAYRDYKLAMKADPKWDMPALELARFEVRSR